MNTKIYGCSPLMDSNYTEVRQMQRQMRDLTTSLVAQLNPAHALKQKKAWQVTLIAEKSLKSLCDCLIFASKVEPRSLRHPEGTAQR